MLKAPVMFFVSAQGITIIAFDWARYLRARRIGKRPRFRRPRKAIRELPAWLTTSIYLR